MYDTNVDTSELDRTLRRLHEAERTVDNAHTTRAELQQEIVILRDQLVRIGEYRF